MAQTPASDGFTLIETVIALAIVAVTATLAVSSYRRHVVRIATFIHAGASQAVREFARAFDLKKER